MSEPERDRDHWARVAADWAAWARTPGHDAFWAYRPALATFIGPGSGEALDVGCGEGRVSRELTALGYRVTAVDPVAELVRLATEARSAAAYAVAPAEALPFGDASFDLVLAHNVLMDVDDVPGALQEMRRVLRPQGMLVISIVHPWIERGELQGEGDDVALIQRGGYFGRQRFEDTEERDGLRMHWAGWSQPLEDYAVALERAGLAITSLREPRPELGEAPNRMGVWTRFPLFLWLKARALAG